MTVPTKQLVKFLDDYLRISEIPDYGPQGLQVEAERSQIGRIALAVDVSPPIIAAAAAWDAHMLLVHHGILWGQLGRIAGPLGERVRRFLSCDMHLYGAHLPLDAHPEVGNNAVLADLLELKNRSWFAEIKGTPLVVVGDRTPTPVSALVEKLNTELPTQARVLAHGPDMARRIAILSGSGADYIEAAVAQGADTFVTGETSHAHFWLAADYGINVIFAGHYATETVGVKALGRLLTEKFGVETHFIDFPTDM